MELQATLPRLHPEVHDGGSLLKKPAYKGLLVLVFSVTALLSFMAAAFFIFNLVADVSDDLARSASEDPARRELARLIARDKAVGAAGSAFVFLLAQAGLQIAALVISSFIATRGLDAEFGRMGAVIAEQERKLEESAALSGWKEIASFLSHQLKNPLAAVDLAASNAVLALSRSSMSPADSEKTADSAKAPDPGAAILGEALASIQEETARMKALIGRLKSLTSFEQAAFREESLADLARAAASRFSPARAEIGVSGDARVMADGDLLVQAFVNLLDNSAEEAERSGSTPVSIRLSIGSEGGSAFIAYSDDNSGLAPETAARLGRERFTTKRTGSGLGLLFVSRIMAIHGGGFRAEAGPGGNFTARLDLGPARGAAT